MKKAFSIIELTIVIVLISIISVSVYLSIGNTNSQVLDLAATRMAADIRYAQNLAIARRGWYGVRFSKFFNFYYVYEFDASQWWSEDIVINPAKPGTTMQIEIDEIYDGVAITSIRCNDAFFNYNVIFNPRGEPYGSVAGVPYQYTNDSIIKLTFAPAGCGASCSPIEREVRIAPYSGKVYFVYI